VSFMLRAGWHECVDADGDSSEVLIGDDHSPALSAGRRCLVADGQAACADSSCAGCAARGPARRPEVFRELNAEPSYGPHGRKYAGLKTFPGVP